VGEVEVHQLVFGYEHGHRRLAGSIASLGDPESLLLGATDAPVEGTRGRLLTALPLPGRDHFAVAGTWAAPELGRPGAVWSHVLLVPVHELEKVEAPSVIVAHLRRPTPDTLELYAQPLLLDLNNQGVGRPAPSAELVAHALASGERDENIVLTRDLAAGEAALLFLWDLAWPALRANLAFRTRDSIRAGRHGGFLTVTRRIKGMAPAAAAKSEPPSRAAAWLLSHTWECRRSLSRFGSEQPPQLQSIVVLAEILELVSKEEASRTARAIERRFPKPHTARTLKHSLFGLELGPDPAWACPEPELVKALLATRRPAWDFEELQLGLRLSRLASEGQAVELVVAHRRNGPGLVRALLLGALIEAARPRDVAGIDRADRPLAAELLGARVDLLASRGTWRRMSGTQAVEVLEVLGNPPDAVGAALKAGHSQALLGRLPPDVLLGAAVLAEDHSVLRSVVSSLPDGALGTMAVTEPRVALAAMAAGWSPRTVGEACEFFEASRSEPDTLWLRAAVELLAVQPERDELGVLLQTVFGPLHHAVTADRLPPDAWAKLDQVLPKARDPALRLRRLLADVAQREDWGPSELEKAIRDAGPDATELRHEVKQDDALYAVLKAVSKAAKRLAG
jgi:hypothetical protein